MKQLDNGDGYYMDIENQAALENEQDLVTMERYEDAMKTVMRTLRTVRVAAYERQLLDEKLKAHRCMADLEKCLGFLRSNYYEIETAIEDARQAEFCTECGEQTPHAVVSCG